METGKPKSPEAGPAPFFPKDIQFLREFLGAEIITEEDLALALRDPVLKSILLGDPMLWRELRGRGKKSGVSSRLFYYAAARQALLRADLDDPLLAENTASCLVKMARLQARAQPFYLSRRRFHPVSFRVETYERKEGVRVRLAARLGQYRMETAAWLSAPASGPRMFHSSSRS